mgnify:CR=1 FL=1
MNKKEELQYHCCMQATLGGKLLVQSYLLLGKLFCSFFLLTNSYIRVRIDEVSWVNPLSIFANNLPELNLQV